MRQLTVFLSTVLAATIAGQAGAAQVLFRGTLDIGLGALPSMRCQDGNCVGACGTVSNSTGGGYLNVLRLAGGIAGSGTIPVTDPEISATIPSIRISVTLGTGTLSGISGAQPLKRGKLPVGGFTRVCLLVPGCATNISLNNTTNNGNTGLGVGGLLTVGKLGSIRISLINGPWTLGTASGITQTHEGSFKTKSAAGWVHGAASSSTATAEPSSVIQLIAPQQVTTSGIAGNSTELALFARLTIHFIPEPGLIPLIGAGAVGLGLLGHSRMKRSTKNPGPSGV